MKDLHSHICFGIDDGCKTKEQSIALLRKMSEAGFTDILLTPHYVDESEITANNEKKKEILKELQKECKKEKININLYLGNEVYITDNCIDLIKKDKIMTLNNSRYVLIEFSMFRSDPNARTILHNIIASGYIPIIAHPERYEFLDKKFDYLKEFVEMGVLFQGNYQSLFGKYGKFPKKNLQKMLKQGMISFIGSDIHHDEELHTEKLYKELKKYVKKDELVKDLLENNFDKVINNEIIEK